MTIMWQGHKFHEHIGSVGSQDAAQWLGEQMKALLPDDVDRCRVGIYVATTDAAVDVSVSFWKAAINEGVDFVNPRDFPWTLASAIAAHAARKVGIRGPCITLVGGSEVAIAVLSHGIHDLQAGIIDLALVAGVDPSSADLEPRECPAAVIALALDRKPCIASVESCTETIEMDYSPHAAETLLRACQAVESCKDIVIGTPYEGKYLVCSKC